MAKVAEARDAATEQLARLDRGEEVSGGLGRSMTQEDCVRILKAAGRTTSNIRHAMDLAEQSRIGCEQAFVLPILVNGLQVHNRVQTCGTAAWSSMPTPLQRGENNGPDERPLKGHFGPSRLRH
jgi:hypothetical protein